MDYFDFATIAKLYINTALSATLFATIMWVAKRIGQKGAKPKENAEESTKD